MKTSPVARRYATALLEASQEAGKTPKVSKDLDAVAALWDESAELRAVFQDPRITGEDRKKVIDGLGQRLLFAPITTNTLKLMADNGRLSELPNLVTAYAALARRVNEELQVEVTTAKLMAPTFYSNLQRTLSDSTGMKINLVKLEDPELIGGVVTRVQDKVYDGSLKSRLRQLKEQLLA